MKGMHEEDSSMNSGYILRLQSNASLQQLRLWGLRSFVLGGRGARLSVLLVACETESTPEQLINQINFVALFLVGFSNISRDCIFELLAVSANDPVAIVFHQPSI
jgi:hypothetical protein